MRLKVLLSLFATVFVLITVVHLLTQSVFVARFDRLEKAQLPAATKQVATKIADRSRQLRSQLRDWSHWTDAQQFLNGRMPDFERRSFSSGTLGEMGVSSLVYADLAGAPKLKLGADDGGKQVAASAYLLEDLKPNGRLHAATSGVLGGLIGEGDGIYEFAAGPVTSTDGAAAPNGICLFARKLDAKEITRIRKDDELKSLELLPLTSAAANDLLADVLKARGHLLSKPESEERLSVYAPLFDFEGHPVALSRVSLPRTIHMEGRHAVLAIAIELAATSVLLSGLTFLLFETLVLSRVSEFSHQLRRLAVTGDLSMRIRLGGDDEMAGLAKPVNTLLESLATTNAVLHEQQEQLLTSEYRLSAALTATGDGLWDWSRASGLYLSSGSRAILGLPESASVTLHSILRRFFPPDRIKFWRAMSPAMSGHGEMVSLDVRMQTEHAGLRWVQLRGQVIERDAEGNAVRVVGLAEDVTERRDAENAMRESRELFRSAFDGNATGMALAGLDGRLLRVNPQLCELLGYSADELHALRFQDFTHPDDVALDVSLFGEMIRGERRHYTMEKRYIRKDGHIVWVLLTVGLIQDSAGKPLYGIGQVQDITQRRRSEEELQAYARRLLMTKEELERRSIELSEKTMEAQVAKRVAEQASGAKSAFLAHMSHEIRTPMTGILGFADLLLKPDLPESDRQRHVETIIRNGQHLLALMNEILDLSKIEAGKMTLELIDCDPARIIADVEATLGTRASSKNIALNFKVADDVPPRIRTDPTRLCQILLNIVGNAVKFTNSGRIDVSVSMVRGNGRPRLRFLISDTGIGMTAAQVDRLFEPFHQADISTTRRFGGTGLGMAISKRLVEMLDGNIVVHSETGRGTQCCVTIGLGGKTVRSEAPAPEPKAEKPQQTSLTGLRILLAEDGPDNQYLMRYYLESAGASVVIAEDGRVAVEKAASARAAGEGFDLILMDIQMPEMDGLAATRALRAQGYVAPILALTAHGTTAAREQSLAAGCCDHLIKPIQRDVLLQSIGHWVNKQPQGPRLHSRWESAEGFEAILNEYVSELPRQVRQLLDHARRQDLESLRRTAHQIRGAGGGYGFADLSMAAGQVETAIVEKRLDSIANNVDSLIAAIRSVHGYDPLLEEEHAPARTHH